MKLVFDTETTGMVVWDRNHKDPKQPKLVQLAAELYDDQKLLRASYSAIVYPEAGWTSHPKAVETHGITDQMAREMGMPFEQVLETFCEFLDLADETSAHNNLFDLKVMRHAFHLGDYEGDPFGDRKNTCTMTSAQAIVKAKDKIGRVKKPSLEECAQYFFKESVIGAHDALVDTKMCARVYWELVEMGSIK